MSTALSVAIVIASKGRSAELGRWIDHINRQTQKPAAVVFSVTAPADLPPGDLAAAGITPIMCQRAGSCLQRNAGLDAIEGRADVIAFFDDDYVPSKYCIERMSEFFASFPNVVAANGVILADGANSAGIPYREALATVEYHDSAKGFYTLCHDNPIGIVRELSGLYGCNMAFRAEAIGRERFDENLPDYGWQEDIDFAARVGRRGDIVKTNAFYGVHQGVKSARTSGIRLGYSQIVNPLYLVRKGTMRAGEAARLIMKTFVKNHVRALLPEPWVDRRGRCLGNWRAIRDIVAGRDDPANILAMA